MSEITDDMIDCVYCQQCGQYFKKFYGYPVICAECDEKEKLECK